ncbi:MAG: zinc ribbon domain-containing protein, partial [Deltaproteobacteria bacterium]|nr:zinc ribbon domain-containing protein [Deltaproteobacteria bacterium]MBW2536278.1 zinc ribbon domain-containing protein [Deltaproteobacteria bacterium]
MSPARPTEGKRRRKLLPDSAQQGALLAVLLVVMGAGLATPLGGPGLTVLVLAAAALGAAIVAFWLSLRSLSGDRAMTPEEAYALAAPLGEDEQKRTVLRALRDLEYERSVGKISAEDYDALRADYRREAQELLHQEKETDRAVLRRVRRLVAGRLDPESPDDEDDEEGRDGDREQEPRDDADEQAEQASSCPKCDTRNDSDARFCKHCGKALGALGAVALA